MVGSREILLEHEVNNRHGFLRVYFHIIFINVTMKNCLDETEIRVEVNISFGGIGISHEETIFTLS